VREANRDLHALLQRLGLRELDGLRAAVQTQSINTGARKDEWHKQINENDDRE
jgi:hypothetical protein